MESSIEKPHGDRNMIWPFLCWHFIPAVALRLEDGVKSITVDNPKCAFGMQWYLFSESHGKLASLRAQLLLLLLGSPAWAALGGVPESPCGVAICD